jgi:hypothetical protein
MSDINTLTPVEKITKTITDLITIIGPAIIGIIATVSIANSEVATEVVTVVEAVIGYASAIASVIYNFVTRKKTA